MKHDRASATARVIAAATVMLAHEPRGAGLVPPQAVEWCRLLLSANAADRWLCASARLAPTRALWRWVERATLPGIVEHYAHRKAWIEARCRAAIADGATRVIVIGAGFDTLALRLAPEFADVEWIEVDHPATQNAKQRALESIDRARRPAVEFIAADLSREPLPAALTDSARSSFVVIEGVLMYLEAAQVEVLFAQLRGVSRSGARVVASFMERSADGRARFRYPHARCARCPPRGLVHLGSGPAADLPHSRVVDAWLAQRGEPFLWAADPATLEPWLDGLGFRLVTLAQPPFGGTWRAGTRLRGESLFEAVASRP